MLNESGKREHSYFVSDLGDKTLIFLPLSMMLAVGFILISSPMLGKLLLFLLCIVFYSERALAYNMLFLCLLRWSHEDHLFKGKCSFLFFFLIWKLKNWLRWDSNLSVFTYNFLYFVNLFREPAFGLVDILHCISISTGLCRRHCGFGSRALQYSKSNDFFLVSQCI